MVSCIRPPLLAWSLWTTGFVWSSDEVAVHLEFRLGSSSLSGLLSLETAWNLGSAWSILPSLLLSLEIAGGLLLGVNFLELLFPSCLTELLVCLFGAEEACHLSWSPGCDPVVGDKRAKQWLRNLCCPYACRAQRSCLHLGSPAERWTYIRTWWTSRYETSSMRYEALRRTSPSGPVRSRTGPSGALLGSL